MFERCKSWLEQRRKAKENPYKDFRVVNYPSGLYYAMYQGWYLGVNKTKGVVEVIGSGVYFYADKFNTEEDAWNLVERFREERLKVNVKYLTKGVV